jgi:hypothetical protein
LRGSLGPSASRLTSEWLLSSRVDYNVSSNQRIFFRFKTDQGYLPVAPSYINPLFDQISRQPDYEGQVNHTLLITPRLVNNFIGSVTYNSFVFSGFRFERSPPGASHPAHNQGRRCEWHQRNRADRPTQLSSVWAQGRPVSDDR